MGRKFLPFTISKDYKKSYIRHCVADFETCYTDEERTNVRVWSWGLYDYMTSEYSDGNHIDTFFNEILEDKFVYDIGFHNLKFDGTFIIPQLFKRGYTYLPNDQFMKKWENGDDMKGLFTHNITAMGHWFNITIVKNKNATPSTPAFVHIWDTFKLFPKKLSEIAIQYNTNVKKMEVSRDFYEAIRPEGHIPTEEEKLYQKQDCLSLGQALYKQFEKYGTVYRTQASKAFTFFKACCTDEAGNVNYKIKYEGIKQWTVPDIEGLEDYKGATVRYLPRKVRDLIDKSGAKLVEQNEYYIPDFFTWQDIKRSYFGGISYVNPFYQERSLYEKITVIDVNSMYPFCLRKFPIPYGRFTKYEGAPDFKKSGGWIACARVSFKLKDDYRLPCIQIKDKYGRQWLRESTDFQKYGEMNIFNDDVIFFTSIDYETYKESYDFVVHKWLYHYHFPFFANKDGKTFIDKFYKEKQRADNLMKKIKQEDPEGYKTNPLYIRASEDRQEAKVAMNSAYGKHGTKYFLLAKDSLYLGPDEPVLYKAETHLSRDPEQDPSHYYCPYAAFVTAYARRMLVTTWNAFKGRALYCDTDSIHFLGEEIPDEIIDQIDFDESGELGLWKVEGRFVKARYIRSKAYIEVKANGEEVVTCAGATPEIKKLMNWDTFRVGFSAWAECEKHGLDYRDYSKLTPKQYPDGVALEPVPFEIKPNL